MILKILADIRSVDDHIMLWPESSKSCGDCKAPAASITSLVACTKPRCSVRFIFNACSG